MTENVLVDIDQGVMTVTLNRPEKKNALTLAMYEGITAAIEQAEEDIAIALIVITGAGDFFTSGNDIADFLSVPPDSEDSPVVRFLKAISSTDVPIIAAVNGPAIGVGTTMLMYCEKVYCTESTSFRTPFISLAVVPEAASSLLMPKSIGYQRAAQMLLFGEPMDAQAAVACGLVSQVCPADTLQATVAADAARIAELPRRALRNGKRLLRRDEEPVATRIRHEMELFGAALQSAESQEAMSAFIEKRKPDFSGLG